MDVEKISIQKSLKSLNFEKTSNKMDKNSNVSAISFVHLSDSPENNRNEELKTEELNDSKKKSSFTLKQILVIFLLCYGNFCISSAYSLLAPFFPHEVSFLVSYIHH